MDLGCRRGGQPEPRWGLWGQGGLTAPWAVCQGWQAGQLAWCCSTPGLSEERGSPSPSMSQGAGREPWRGRELI